MKKRLVGIIMVSLIIITSFVFAEGASFDIYMESFVFQDADTNTTLSDTLSKNISVFGNVKNKGESRDAFFIVSVYDDRGVLSGINRKEVTLNENTPVELSVENTLNAKKGKIVCFLWSVEDMMSPVSKTVEFIDGVIDYKKENSQFYISLSGSENGNGSKDNPFDSIKTARDYINNVKNNIDEDIIVNIEEGVYELSEPVYFGYEDSGVNGNKIIYKGSGIKNTVISGGEKISGWDEEENGIYSVELHDREFVKELYVNNRFAQRSRTQNVIHGVEFYNDEAIVVDYDEKLASIKEYDNAEISSLGDWRDLRIKISKAVVHPEDNTKLILYFKEGKQSVSKIKDNFASRDDMTNKAVYAFSVENAKGLLDEENEFYFDKYEKKLYYKSPDGNNPDDFEIYIPNFDKLVVFKGENSGKKVSGIEFENISFMHTGWERMEDEAYHPFQGVMFYANETKEKDLFPLMGMVPAAIQLDMAENICIRNNTLACLGGVGIGIYNGVKNCDFSENIITQVSHSGINVGLPSHQDTDTKNNVAFRKPATASTSLPGNSASTVTDGDLECLWLSELTDTSAWVQVDLGKEYKISGIGLNFNGSRYSQTSSGDYERHEAKNFRVVASNDPNFKSGIEILVPWVTTDVGVNNEIKSYTCSSTKPYRYVRYMRKEDTTGKDGSGALADLYVYSNDDGAVLSKEGCVNNNIENNYIAQVGLRYADAIGIQVFYTNSTVVKNNTIREVPYSGISIGWGWERQRRSLDVKNNKIINNRIENCLMKLRDGAGIYILGMQPGLEVSGNYIKGIRNAHGGIYPDNGTVGYSYPQKTVNPIVIKNNVVEDSSMWFHGWHPSAEYIHVTDNFTTTSRQLNAMNDDYPANGINNRSSCKVENTQIYVKSNRPEQVKNIISASGAGSSSISLDDYMRENFKFDSKKNLMKETENTSRVKNLIGMFVLKQPDVNVKEKKELYENTVDNYINFTSYITPDGIRPRTGHRDENLEWVIFMYNYYSIILENNPTYLNGYENEYSVLSEVIESVKSVRTNTYSSLKSIFEARIRAENALEAFEKSGIFYDKANTTLVLDDSLISQIAKK